VSLFVIVAGAPAPAQDAPAEPPPRWADTAELSYVVTAGNAETKTLGFANKLVRNFDNASFTLRLAGVRAESTRFDPVAVGTADSFSVDDRESTETTAEQYLFEGRYDRNISERFFWFTGAGWDRNVPAGIENRTTAFGGVGNTWIDREDMRFKTDYSVTYTDQQDVIPNPAVEDSFFGARFSYTYFHRFTESTAFDHTLTIDENLDETSDWRAQPTFALTVTMSERLALKVGLVLLYDNEPALESIPLYDVDPDTPGAVQLGTVLVEKEELDTIFTTSLVVNF